MGNFVTADFLQGDIVDPLLGLELVCDSYSSYDQLQVFAADLETLPILPLHQK